MIYTISGLLHIDFVIFTKIKIEKEGNREG